MKTFYPISIDTSNGAHTYILNIENYGDYTLSYKDTFIGIKSLIGANLKFYCKSIPKCLLEISFEIPTLSLKKTIYLSEESRFEQVRFINFGTPFQMNVTIVDNSKNEIMVDKGGFNKTFTPEHGETTINKVFEQLEKSCKDIIFHLKDVRLDNIPTGSILKNYQNQCNELLIKLTQIAPLLSETLEVKRLVQLHSEASTLIKTVYPWVQINEFTNGNVEKLKKLAENMDKNEWNVEVVTEDDVIE